MKCLKDIVTVEMLKKFGEVQETTGSAKGELGTEIGLCGLALEKGYVYEVTTVVSQSTSNQNAINNNIKGTNCSVRGRVTVGYGGSGGGVSNSAIVIVGQNNASVLCTTYIYDNSIIYSGYIRARKIGIV
ncbi:hypothetical protein [Faecalibacillus faecis]|uniref:hypothetical protein n=1 Tax=Faecalibacillus faecis TaxID=1982628 RepID=UPI002F929AA9